MANGNEFGNLTASIETDEERKRRLAAEAARQNAGSAVTQPPANIVAPSRAMTQPAVSPTGQAAPRPQTALSNNTYGQPFSVRTDGATPAGLPAGWTPAQSIANLDRAKAAGFTPKPTPKQPMQLTDDEAKAGASVGPGTGPVGSASYTNAAGNIVSLSPSQVGDKAAIRSASAGANVPPLLARPAPTPIVPPMPPALASGTYAPGQTTQQSVNANVGAAPGVRAMTPIVSPKPYRAPGAPVAQPSRVMPYNAPGNPVQPASRVMSYDEPGNPVSAASEPARAPFVMPANMELDPATGKPRYKAGLRATVDRIKSRFTPRGPFVQPRPARTFQPNPYGVGPGRV